MIQQRIEEIFKTIEETSLNCDRDISEINLVGVTKAKPLEMIREAFESGLKNFGESYVDDFSDKESHYHPSGLNYHFIGRLPTRKARKVVGKVKLIHSVSSIKLAKKIDFVASEEAVCQDILIQVNQGGELSKSGIDSDCLNDIVSEVIELSNIRVCGLMSIPPFHEPARPYFSQLRNLRENLQENLNIELPFLSMGMSEDFVEAITEGSTHIRIGTSIFGQR